MLATIYGSFLSSKPFRDVDIAIFTGYSISFIDVGSYEEEISLSIEDLVSLPIDVKVIDYAPPWFRVTALGGLVIVEKIPCLAVILKFKSLQEVNDFEVKKRKIYLLFR